MADRFLIAPYDQSSGQQTDIKPWLIPDEAFAELTNAYVFRGRIRKRFGSLWLGNESLSSRFRVYLGTTDGAGNITTTVPMDGVNPIVTPAVGQIFSIGTQVFTIDILGSPQNLLISGTATLARFNETTGVIQITGADHLTALYYYPALPVMGLLSAETSNISTQAVIGFDTKFAYQYVNGWERLSQEVDAGASVWNGSDSQFFWSTNWSGADPGDHIFFVTNNNPNEPNSMRYYNLQTLQWNNFRPALATTGTPLLFGARLLVLFKNRIVALNTWEGAAAPGINYYNRARYCRIGSPLDPTAFYADVSGKGNAMDAPTSEAIITAEFVKDRLIVYFERSTWELAYTGNQLYPFSWQQINSELGAESTFSVVPFDKVALGVGNVGIMACNGSNTERIDSKIPDTVFSIHNANNAVNRVYGVRDFYTEMVYWTFPDITQEATTQFPNRILIYNYKNNTWAMNYDSITCFGYFQPISGITWNSTTVTWDDSVTWGSGSIQSQFRQVIAGNQQGFTFLCDSQAVTNASVLQITQIAVINNVVTIYSLKHNLRIDEYIYFQGIVGTGNLSLINDKIFQITSATTDDFTFIYTDSLYSVLAGIYMGGGLIARVSKITIKTKEYNFYAKQGRNAFIQRVDFLVDKTNSGQMIVQFYASTSAENLLSISAGNRVLLGTGSLDTYPYNTIPLEQTSTRLWRPIYMQAEGNVVQLELTMNDAQMRNTDMRKNDFQLHAMAFTSIPTTARLW
jgi:hypothetical protein